MAHRKWGMMVCPVCEEPSRLVIEENGVVLTCSPCGLQIHFAASVLRKPNVDALIEHGKEEVLMTCHGTKEIARAIAERDAAVAKGAKAEDVAVLDSAIATAAVAKKREMESAARKNGEK